MTNQKDVLVVLHFCFGQKTHVARKLPKFLMFRFSLKMLCCEPAAFVAFFRWSKESNEDFTSAVSPLACLRRCFCIALLFLRVFDDRVFKSRRPSSNTLNRWKQRSGKALQALAGKEQTVFELLKTTLNTRFFSHKTPINKNVGKTKFRRNYPISSRWNDATINEF